MSTNRITRVNELVQREIASSLYKLNTGGKLDLAKVTVTHVITSPDLRKSRVLVSYMGDREAGDAAVRLLNRKRKELQRMLADNVVLKYTPHLLFALDQSVEQGNRVLEILEHLPPPSEDDEDEFPEPEE